jgi:hypothetical protein
MSGYEVMVFAVCALLGYWLVSLFLQRKSKQAWHQVLNVEADASIEHIKAAYQALMSQYDPAERKSKEITRAYREAMRSRGLAE